MKLAIAQRRLITDMVGSSLRQTPQAWFAKSHRPHSTETALKCVELGLIRWRAIERAYELTEHGFREATEI